MFFEMKIRPILQMLWPIWKSLPQAQDNEFFIKQTRVCNAANGGFELRDKTAITSKNKLNCFE